jgi:hypothetical protein
MAETLAKDANKLASSFAYNFPSFTVSTMSGAAGESSSGDDATSASTALVNLSKSHLQMVSDKLVVALKDNDMIYHETIPPVDSLEPLEKLNAVKPTSFTDLLPNGQADVQKIVGSDIFIKLVPLSVHEASSMYSEEKAQLRRREQHRCQLADDEVDATIESLNLMKTLDKLKTVIKDPSSLGEEFTLPQEVMDWSITVQTDESKGSKNKNDMLQSKIESLKPPIQEMLAEVTHLLEKEQHECENMRVSLYYCKLFGCVTELRR